MAALKYGTVDDTVIGRLIDIVGSENVSTRDEDIYCYSFDSSFYSHKPDVIVKPRTVEQVSEILKLANELRIPVTVRGSGTNLAGLTIPVAGGIVMDMTAMNRILEVNVDDQYVVVEAGVVCDDLNDYLKDYGYFFPPDPSSSPVCTIGGMIGTNAAGNRAIKYGTTKDHVLWLEVVLPTGEVVHMGSKTLKSVSGFNLVGLMVGSEGSLGVITKACLKMTPLPEAYATAYFIFDSIWSLGKAATRIRATRVIPEMLEFMDRNTTREALDYVGLEAPEGAFLLLDFGGLEGYVEKELERCLGEVLKEKPVHYETTTDPDYREKLVSARKASLPALARLAPTTVVEDLTVPLSKVPETCVKLEELPGRLGVEGFYLGNYGHIGDGNMHPTFVFDGRVEEHVKAFRRGMDIIYEEIVIPMGGTVTGEHGVGLAKAKYLELEYEKGYIEVMRRIKRLLDPNMILNPGKGKGGPYPLEVV